MNRVELIGRTTRDIDLRYTPNTQTAVGNFTLAVPRERDRDKTDYFRCTVWGRQAENMERFVKKGYLVGVVGRIETDSYTNRNGVDVSTTEVIVEGVDFLEPRHGKDKPAPASEPAPPAEQPSAHQQSPDNLPDSFEQADDDLPF